MLNLQSINSCHMILKETYTLSNGLADLIIIHCPQPWAEFRGAKRYFKENKAVWKALENYGEDSRWPVFCRKKQI